MVAMSACALQDPLVSFISAVSLSSQSLMAFAEVWTGSNITELQKPACAQQAASLPGAADHIGNQLA